MGNEQIAEKLVQYRLGFSLFSVLMILVLAYGLKDLRFESDYKIFFKADNPQLLAHEKNQDTYTKTDNITFVIAPKDGVVFSSATLASIIELTHAAWQIPFSLRVDSITNFQHTSVEGDSLVVADLIREPENLSSARLEELRGIALNEPLLVSALISNRAHATAVSVNLSLPDNRVDADQATIEAVDYGRKLSAQFEAANPNLKIYLVGQTMVNRTFNEMSVHDMTRLIPLMFVLIVVILQLMTRSLSGTIATMMLIGLSVLTTQGFMGWVGFSLNQVNVACPVIILTLAVCDAVHIINQYLAGIAEGMLRIKAMQRSLSINLKPIFLTSLTTAMGFISMNFSDSPPFQELGTIAAFGVMMAFLLSLTLFPAMVLLLPQRIREASKSASATRVPEAIGRFAVRYHNPLFYGLLAAGIILAGFTFKNNLNDDTVGYFHKDVPFRQAADYTQENLTGFHQIAYSLNSGESDGINKPEFLAQVDAFAKWYSAQPEVVHVSVFTNIVKRLNQNMHNDQAEWYRLPDQRDLIAQYVLLYEMSLPYGLDLNNQINSDKSALLLQVRVKGQKAKGLIALDQRAQDWLVKHAPELTTLGSGVSLMFANIGQRNIDSMLEGSVVALILVTLTLIISLRSIRYGLLSLLPNAFPAAMAFGLWGIFVGEVNLAVAVIFTITLGIVVDDTVHFITKYLHAREHYQYDAKESVMYAFKLVGKPIITTTVVLASGFFVLAFSSFDVNSSMGLMVGITIVIALVWDLLFLPALLIKADQRKKGSGV